MPLRVRVPFAYETDGTGALQPFLLGGTLVSLVAADETKSGSAISRHWGGAANDFDVGAPIASEENAAGLAIGLAAGGVPRDLMCDLVGDRHQASLREEDHPTEPPHAGQ